MLIVAVVNQKGGVGKTTVTLGLAGAAQAAGRRTLVVDLDPQANATVGLGLASEGLDANDVLVADRDGVLREAIYPSGWGRDVDVVGATLELASRETDTSLGSEFRLRKAMRGLAGYELVLVDCPPSLGRLTINGLVAADYALVVTEPSAPALRGVEQVLRTCAVVAEHYNPALAVAGVVVNKMPGLGVEANRRLAELFEVFGDETVWRPPITHRAVLAEALGAQAPVQAYKSKAADTTAVLDALLGRVLALAPKER